MATAVCMHRTRSLLVSTPTLLVTWDVGDWAVAILHVLRHACAYLLLLAPAGGDMVDGVAAAAAEEEQGPVRAAEQADALGVAKHGKA